MDLGWDVVQGVSEKLGTWRLPGHLSEAPGSIPVTT